MCGDQHASESLSKPLIKGRMTLLHTKKSKTLPLPLVQVTSNPGATTSASAWSNQSTSSKKVAGGILKSPARMKGNPRDLMKTKRFLNLTTLQWSKALRSD
jgi:hypothetical protein